jgi:transposase
MLYKKKKRVVIKNNKAPGSDGFSTEFYKASWTIISDEVVQAIQSFFEMDKLLKEVNATIIITLVPKNLNPFAMSEFRQILSCNVIYKCITKILVDNCFLAWMRLSILTKQLLLRIGVLKRMCC